MDAQENETMTRVGPGTPAGETLRRYWLPVLFSDEINSEQPNCPPPRGRPVTVPGRIRQGRLDRTHMPAPRHVARIRLDRSRRHPLLLSWLGLRRERTLHRSAGRALWKQFQRQDQAQSLPNPRARRYRLGLYGPRRTATFSTLRLSRPRRWRTHAQWLPARVQLYEPARQLSRSGARHHPAWPRRERRAAESGTCRKPRVRSARRRPI